MTLSYVFGWDSSRLEEIYYIFPTIVVNWGHFSFPKQGLLLSSWCVVQVLFLRASGAGPGVQFKRRLT